MSAAEPTDESATGAAEGSTDDTADWLGTDGFFRAVIGHRESVELLNDPRLQADIVAMFEAAGVRSGRFWEVLSASLLSTNGEEHRRARAVVASRFTPRSVEDVRPVLREAAHRLIDELAPAGRCEVVRDFAWRYSAIGSCAFLGFDVDEVEPLSDALRLVSFGTKDLMNHVDLCEEGMMALVDYGTAAVDARRGHPTSDVLSDLAGAVDAGEIEPLVAYALAGGLLSAGHEPTTNQIAIMIDLLSGHPDIWAAVASGELDVAPVVEEVLRFRSTNRGTNRRIAESFEFHGVELCEGEQLLISTGQANLDPRRYTDPDRFEPRAERGAHLAFGFGPHHCLGAALARAQLQEALRALTARMNCPRVVAKVDPELRMGLVGPSHLQIAFTMRPPATD